MRRIRRHLDGLMRTVDHILAGDCRARLRRLGPRSKRARQHRPHSLFQLEHDFRFSPLRLWLFLLRNVGAILFLRLGNHESFVECYIICITLGRSFS